MHKIIFNSNDLKTAISRTGNVVVTKPIMAIMGTVLISVDGNKATFTGTDTQITLATTMPCESEGFSRVAIDIEDLHNLSKAIPSGISVELSIKVEDVVEKLPPLLAGVAEQAGVPQKIVTRYSVHIKAGRATFDYGAFDPALFPTTPSVENARVVPLDSELVLSIINCLAFCGMETAKLWSMGVYLKGVGDQALTVGCGQFGLRKSILYDAPGIGEIEAILPKPAVLMLRDFTSTTGIELMIPEAEQLTNLAFRNESTIVFVRLIDSRFAPYEQIIPDDYTKGFDFNAGELLNTVRSVAVGTNNDKGGMITLTVTGNEAKVKCENFADNKYGESSTELIKSNDGDIVIGFNAGYLITHLSNLTGEVSALHGGDSMHAIVFQDESRDAIYMLAPMRID